MDRIDDAAWANFERDGWLKVGKILAEEELKGLQQRIDEIMLGEAKIDYNRVMMQLDSETGNYGDAGEQSVGHKGRTLNYRKIQDLELDPLFLTFIKHPIFRDACARIYGSQTPVAVYRAMFMNKPAGRGTFLPWHQDRWTFLDKDPLLTVWTALDPATKENGCVQIIPGTQHELINKDHHSGFLSEDQAKQHVKADQVIYVELEPGETVLLHNHTLHSSDKNQSQQSRRAFSVCYMPSDTKHLKHDKKWKTVFEPQPVG